MTKSLLALTVLAAAAASSVQAAPGDPAPDTRAPAKPLAEEAARTAVSACASQGYRTTATVVDSAGEPVAVQTPGKADPAARKASFSVAFTAAKYHIASSDVAERAKGDAILTPVLQNDPRIRVARPGGVPLSVGDDVIGAIGVAGSPAPDKDEACAKAGAQKVASRLR